MKTFQLKDFTRGWLVGQYEPSIYKKDYELGIKYHTKGDYELSHYHSLSDEVTIVVYGEISMNDIVYKAGDIIIQEKNEATNFCCLSDNAATVCFRPDGSFPNDKHFT